MADLPEVKTVTLSTTAGIPAGTTLETPSGMPNIVVKTVSPIRRTLIRIARVYVQALVGLMPFALGAGQAIADAIAPGQLVLPKEFGGQLILAASAAVAPAGSVLLGNLLELLVKWDTQG